MKCLLPVLLLTLTTASFAQIKETFDVVSYTAPKDWRQSSKTPELIGYVITSQKGTWCQVGIYKSMNTMGSPQLDFDTDWTDLVAKPYKISVMPDAGMSTVLDGWESRSGIAPFEFSEQQSMARLVTKSGHGKRVSILILTNTKDYDGDVENFLASVELSIPETPPLPAVVNISNDLNILGTWGASASDQSSYRMNNGVVSTITRQYTFNANGTYTFITKTFDPLMANLLLGRENGTYQFKGSSLTIHPQKSVLEAWSKKDGTDQWGKPLNSQTIPLEEATYQLTKNYNEIFSEWQLVLRSDKQTKRDGPFVGGATYSNAWIYIICSSPRRPVIQLPD